MTRRTSPQGRVHVEVGDRVRTWKGIGTVRMLGPAPSTGSTNYTWAIVEMDDGHTHLTFDLNTIALLLVKASEDNPVCAHCGEDFYGGCSCEGHSW